MKNFFWSLFFCSSIFCMELPVQDQQTIIVDQEPHGQVIALLIDYLVKEENYEEASEIIIAHEHEFLSWLHFAIKDNKINLVKLFINSIKNIDAPDRSGRNIVHAVVRYGTWHMFELLIASGVDLATIGSAGFNPLQETILGFQEQRDDYDRRKIIEFYLSCPSRIASEISKPKYIDLINRPNKEGVVPLISALITGNFKLAATLVKCGANLDYKDGDGKNLIGQLMEQWIRELGDFKQTEMAVQDRQSLFNKYVQALQFLISFRVPVNAIDENSYTPFLYVIQYSYYPELIAILRYYGASLKILGPGRRTAIDLITERFTFCGPYKPEVYEQLGNQYSKLRKYLDEPFDRESEHFAEFNELMTHYETTQVEAFKKTNGNAKNIFRLMQKMQHGALKR